MVRSLMETAVGLAWILRTDSEARVQRLRLKDLDSRIDLAERIRLLQGDGADCDDDDSVEERNQAVRVETTEPDVADLLDSMREERDQLV